MTTTCMTFRLARLDDLVHLVEIERAASEMFRSLSMDFVADDDPGSLVELTPYADGGRALVSVDAADQPVAYLLLDIVDGAAHIEQVSVHPDHARQGIGRALIEQASSWARARGLPALTLTTYLDVPWNAPYYERLGFRYLARGEETPGLRAIRDHETDLGLDVWPRTSMRRDLGAADADKPSAAPGASRTSPAHMGRGTSRHKTAAEACPASQAGRRTA